MLGLIFSLRLDARKDILSVKSSRSVLQKEFEARVPPPPIGNNRGRKTNILYFISSFHQNIFYNTIFQEQNDGPTKSSVVERLTIVD